LLVSGRIQKVCVIPVLDGAEGARVGRTFNASYLCSYGAPIQLYRITEREYAGEHGVNVSHYVAFPP
jgi:hypothetical protein